MNQETVDYHCKMIREDIAKGCTFVVTCLNYMALHASSELSRREWRWIGAQLVMSGHLTVNDKNEFEVLNEK